MTEVLLAARLRRTALMIALSVLLAAPAWRDAIAEEYPSRIVSLVIAFPAGGGVDTVGRVIAQKLTDALGQQVIVVNRPGAGSVIGTRDVARAPPDGYTLLLLVTGAALPANPGYDLEKDFVPLVLLANVPQVLVVNPRTMPVGDFNGFLQLVRKNPGRYNYASLGQHWPDSRYLVISLSFDAQGEDRPLPWVEDWRCVFDTKTDRFSIPADFAENNAKTVQFPVPKRK